MSKLEEQQIREATKQIKKIRQSIAGEATKIIEVKKLPNEQDWTYVLVDHGNGVKHLAVF